MKIIFEIGDVVQLKSNGPHMTVSKTYDKLNAAYGWVETMWFDDENRIQTDSFPVDGLEKVAE